MQLIFWFQNYFLKHFLAFLEYNNICLYNNDFFTKKQFFVRFFNISNRNLHNIGVGH